MQQEPYTPNHGQPRPSPQVAADQPPKPIVVDSLEPVRRPGRPNHNRKNLESAWKSIISSLGILVSAGLIAIGLTLFVFQSYQVDGPSMQPSLHDNDRLIIVKAERTWARITGDPYVPNRGDVIVFVEHSLTANNGSAKQLIKRVIGLPGDRVVIDNGAVVVYNDEHPEGFQPDTSLPYGDGIDLSVSTNESVDEVVQENQVYVMGDNRYNSMDSRAFGPVGVDNIIGKLIIRIFPFEDMKLF